MFMRKKIKQVNDFVHGDIIKQIDIAFVSIQVLVYKIQTDCATWKYLQEMHDV